MQWRQQAAGLVLYFLAICHPKVAEAQFPNFFNPQQNGFARQAPRGGSFSKVNNNAYQREVDLGGVGLTQGVSNSRALTTNNGGFRNGGTTSITDRNAISRGINLGGLDLGSTLTRTQTRTNGQVSQGIEHDLNIGNVGIGTSLSRDNLRRGFGLQRDNDGRLSLGLGLLNVGLTPNAQQQKAALSQAQVNAQGQNAHARANSQTQSQQQNYGNVGVKETRTQSNAVGRSQFGQTQTNLLGGGGGGGGGRGVGGGGNIFGGGNLFGGGGFFRGRRSPFRPTRLAYYRPAKASLFRPKRNIELSPFLMANGHTTGALTGSHLSSVIGRYEYVSNSASSSASPRSQNDVNTSSPALSQVDSEGNNTLTNAFPSGVGFVGFRRQEQKYRYRSETRFPRPSFLTHSHQNDSLLDEEDTSNATELLDLNQPMYNYTSARQTFGVGLQYDFPYPPPQPRTVNTILDFITNLFSGCVSPCTLDAYYNNKCCNISVPALPPAPLCCQGQQYQYPYRPYYASQQYPINCCSVCNRYSYYGPPPCIRYNTGGFYGGLANGGAGGIGFNFGATSPFGNAGVSLGVPPLLG